ncbi:phytoene desaturase family protein [Nocardioides acrostichi]|uniref:NAD(P)/FAD-dependent oxidoreductase n=1 Tax=Nocardioides acrostichi TaxID=2784339 RepID=A0A930UUU6_9ACTN|nr:NAD(P)/FAD-dependent oxidoreductase [Nocardioides acrostichi]MBF4160601.1 NAD(P)/FAD-dependent oxidoreductase [Nocardioides acrostichi]
MANVVVIGGGLGGLASALRLAKNGHEVTLLERSHQLGGAAGRVEAEGFSWDAGASATLLPAVLRDLFRKTGRPLERELDLEPREIVREHRFDDDTVLTLPGGSRGAQARAWDAVRDGLGEQWTKYVEGYAEDWEVLRQHVFERPWQRDALPPEVTARLDSREMLHKRLRRTFRDERPRLVASHPFVMEGHDLRNVPAWAGLVAYLEQTFGLWAPAGGLARITDLLVERLDTRGVAVRLGVRARDLVLGGGRVSAVAVSQDDLPDEVPAEVVVCAIDPRQLPALARHVHRTMPAIPPVVTHVGLEEPVPELTHEVVLHGDPLLVVRPGGEAPPGTVAWTVLGRGRIAEDVLRALAREHLDVRGRVVHRIDRTPLTLVEQWGQSPMGVLWQGRGTVRQRLGPDTPIPGVFAAGAHATPGAGVPYVGLSAALVAEAIGPA